MSSVFSSLDDHLEQLRGQRAISYRDSQQSTQRNNLREFAVSLREARETGDAEPATKERESFAIGPIPDYDGKVRKGATEGEGNLTKEEHGKLKDAFRKMGSAGSAQARDQMADTAARDIASSVNRGKQGAVQGMISKARSQVVMNFQALGRQVGLSDTGASIAGYALERGLERAGFNVMADKGINSLMDKIEGKQATASSDGGKSNTSPNTLEDKNAPRAERSGAESGPGDSRSAPSSSGNYTPSVASGTRAASNQNAFQRFQANAMDKLSDFVKDNNISREQMSRVARVAGARLQVVSELVTHRETLVATYRTIAGSENAVKAIAAAATDKEVRNALGNIGVAAGETTGVPKSLGSVAVLAGALLRGDKTEDLLRHSIRAGGAILGGLLGGAAGTLAGPAGSAIGGVLGSEGGAHIADAIIDATDKRFGWGAYAEGAQEKGTQITQEELKDSVKVLTDATVEAGKQAGGEKMEAVANEAARRIEAIGDSRQNNEEARSRAAIASREEGSKPKEVDEQSRDQDRVLEREPPALG